MKPLLIPGGFHIFYESLIKSGCGPHHMIGAVRLKIKEIQAIVSACPAPFVFCRYIFHFAMIGFGYFSI